MKINAKGLPEKHLTLYTAIFDHASDNFLSPNNFVVNWPQV